MILSIFIFSFQIPKTSVGFLIFSFQIPKTSVGGGRKRGRRPLVAAAESSLLTVVTAAADDEPFGATTDRGYDEDDDDAVRCNLLQMGWLSLLISSDIRTNYYRFVKSFSCFGYL